MAHDDLEMALGKRKWIDAIDDIEQRANGSPGPANRTGWMEFDGGPERVAPPSPFSALG